MKRLMILAAFALVMGSGGAMAAPRSEQPSVVTTLSQGVCGYADCAVLRGPWSRSLRDGRTQAVDAIRAIPSS